MLSTRSNQATITTLGSTQSQKINLHLISIFTIVIPSREINISPMRHFNHLNLADLSFNIPSKIDALLGANVVEEILLDNKIKNNGLYLRDSILGWVVSDPVAILHANSITTHLVSSSEADTDQLLLKFWELEGKICGPNANQGGITKAWLQQSKGNEASSSLGADSALR